MKSYIVQLIIKEKGTHNKIKMIAKQLSQNAVDNIEQTFIGQMVADPSYYAREEMLEALDEAKERLNSEASDD